MVPRPPGSPALVLERGQRGLGAIRGAVGGPVRPALPQHHLDPVLPAVVGEGDLAHRDLSAVEGDLGDAAADAARVLDGEAVARRVVAEGDLEAGPGARDDRLQPPRPACRRSAYLSAATT
jgi:hypothetical protein